MKGSDFMNKLNALDEKKQIAVITNMAKQRNWLKVNDMNGIAGNFHIVTELDIRVGREYYSNPVQTVKRWWIQERNEVTKIYGTFGECMLRLMLSYNNSLKPILL